jgi:hypothetical protein
MTKISFIKIQFRRGSAVEKVVVALLGYECTVSQAVNARDTHGIKAAGQADSIGSEGF